jgi:cytochrome c
MKNMQIPLELTEQEALDLAQFVKRVGWQEMRQNAVDEDEAYRIRDALDKVRKALVEVGYSPR